MKADRLFLERNCPHCGTIKAILDLDAVASDEFRGTAGQELFVLSSQSNEASIDLLAQYDHSENSMPILVTYDGVVLIKTKDIIQHLQSSGMAK